MEAKDFIFKNSRRLRQEATKAENILWKMLRNKKFRKLKFRRQHPLKNYILDFYCHEKKLCIELDGSGHNEISQALYDAARTGELVDEGLTVLRFKNEMVIKNVEVVLQMIDTYLTPSPSPKGEGS